MLDDAGHRPEASRRGGAGSSTAPMKSAMTPPSGLGGTSRTSHRAQAPQRRREAEREELERDRGLQRVHRLGRVGDHHETVRRGSDDLLPGVRRPPALHQPTVRRHLVGPVDGDIEAVEREGPHADPELAGGLLGAGRSGDATERQPPSASAGSR